jgi:hypothetical protein
MLKALFFKMKLDQLYGKTDFKSKLLNHPRQMPKDSITIAMKGFLQSMNDKTKIHTAGPKRPKGK